jgi:MoaA/NifB/PqqE/SkfB family radical SAM enzyme
MNELLKKPRVYEKVQSNGMRIVRIEPSYICNLHCQHCCIREFQSKQGKAMTIQDIQSISEQADELGFAQFVISGGEPLIYPNFDKIVKAIDPQKFYITTDTNGWYLDWKRAKHLKSIGVDKVQVSIDSLDRETHDKFRGREGSWELAINAIRNCKQVGLRVIVQTVVDKERAYSQELIDFIEYFNAWNVLVYIGYAKPVGAWKENKDAILTVEDINYVETLARKYGAFSHLTPDGHCIAVRRMINITKWGDVNPCPFMQEYSIGNIFNEPLEDIVACGMVEFGERVPTCMMATDRDYLRRKNEIHSK